MPGPTSQHSTPPLPRWLLVLIAVHIAWGAARLPTKVWGKRLEEIEQFRSGGAAQFFLENKHRSGAAIVQRIVDETTEDCIVLWRGDWKGAMEFVPPLIAPRLLVAESAWRAPSGRWSGARVARLRRSVDGPEDQVVLEGLGDRVEWVER